MGRNGARAGSGAPTFEQHYGLQACDAAGYLEETAPVFNLLHIGSDDARGVVLCQVFHQVSLGHVGFIAHADQVRKADLFPQHGVHHPTHRGA